VCEGVTVSRQSRLRSVTWVPDWRSAVSFRGNLLAHEENVKLPTVMNQAVVRRARGVRAIRTLLAGAVLCCAFAPAITTEAAPKSKDKREIKAREAFAEGRYEEALDLFAKLYAEKLHPTYLRNIGRCYQNLQQPDKAINSFRDYLRQAKDVTAAEEKEVEGYIAEMEALKKKQEDGQAASAAPPPTIPVPAAPPVEASQGVTAASLTETPATPSPEPSPPFYTRGWFWGVVGGVVAVGVVGGLWAAGVFKPASQCPSGANCKTLGGN
jgi:Tetratricopeptide repeat